MKQNDKLTWNTFIYTMKSIIGIIFPMITFPYVSNILGANNIGKVEYANSISIYFIYFAALGILTYAVREGSKYRDDKEKLSKLATELLLINLCSSAIAYIGILFVVQINIFSDYAVLILINSITIIATTLGMEWIYNVKEDFTFITIRYIIVNIISIIFLFTFVKEPNDYYVYAVYMVMSSAGSSLINVFFLKKHINVFNKRKLELAKHIKPLLLLFSISIVSTIFSNLDTTMLGLMAGNTEVGIYQAGLKIDKIAIAILAAVSTVIFARSSYLVKDGYISENSEFKKLIVDFNGMMMMVATPLAIGIMAISHNITAVLLSDEYAKSGYVLAIISLNILVSAIGRIYGHQILITTGNDKKYFFATVIGLIINVGINLVLIPRLGAIATALSTVIACAISNVLVVVYAGKITNIKSMVLTGVKYLLITLPFLPIAYTINLTTINEIIKMIAIICVCGVYYLSVLIFTKDKYIYEFFKKIKSKRRA